MIDVDVGWKNKTFTSRTFGLIMTGFITHASGSAGHRFWFICITYAEAKLPCVWRLVIVWALVIAIDVHHVASSRQWSHFSAGVCSAQFCADLLLGNKGFGSFSVKYECMEAPWTAELNKENEVAARCKLVRKPFIPLFRGGHHRSWHQCISGHEKWEREAKIGWKCFQY